jgi:serine protease
MPPRARHLTLAALARRPLRIAACAVALALGMLAATPILESAHASRHSQASRRPQASGRPQARTSPSTVAGSYAPGEILVKYATATGPLARAATARAAGATGVGGYPVNLASHTRLLRLAPGVSVPAALRRLRDRHDVLWAVPDYVARTAGEFIPNDPGLGPAPADWEKTQWNFVGEFSVNAPEAWTNVAADGAPGGRGVIVAVLDTGVAYANRGRFRRSPDFGRHEFVRGFDFVSNSPYPNDHNGHGTFVAGTIAEATNNHYGLTGLAYGVRLMPVRVLNKQGEGNASTIAKGVRFAVRHGARVINLSLEFSSEVTASDIPELIEALRYARRRGVVVVAAAGNEGHSTIAYPARAPDVIAVGATTEHGCLANYSNDGSGLTLVAPGGGADADLPGDPNCHPELPSGHDVYQMTFIGSSPRRFGFPSGYEGTSMASPHVAATAALIIASGVLGPRPSAAQVATRLRATARPLGGAGDSRLYGAGLVNAGAATAPGGPGAVAK